MNINIFKRRLVVDDDIAKSTSSTNRTSRSIHTMIQTTKYKTKCIVGMALKGTKSSIDDGWEAHQQTVMHTLFKLWQQNNK